MVACLWWGSALANPSTYRLSYVLCNSTGQPASGELITAQQRTLSRRLNAPGVATVQIRMEDPQALSISPGLSRIKIYRSATPSELALNPAASKVLVFYGSLPVDGVSEDTNSGLLTAAFQDPRWVLRDRYIGYSSAIYSQYLIGQTMDYGNIAAALINTENAKQAFWLTPSGTTGITASMSWKAGLSIASCLDELTKITGGPDFDVTPLDGWTIGNTRQMGTFTTYRSEGQDRPQALFYLQQQVGSSGGNGNITGVRSTYPPIYTASTAQVTDSLGVVQQQTYQLPSNNYDLLEIYETPDHTYTASALLGKAQGVVAENSSPRRMVEVTGATWDAPLPLVDYDLGDTVRLTVKRGTISLDRAVYRVMGYDLVADQEGNVNAMPLLVVPS